MEKKDKKFSKFPRDNGHSPKKRDDRFDGNRRDTRRNFDDQPREELSESGIVAGRNAVRELLKSGRDIDKIFTQAGEREGSIVVLAAEAISRGIPVVETEKSKLDALSGFTSHQGIVAMAAFKGYSTIDEILAIARERGEKPFVVIADEICDPNNLGALIRCCEGAGVHGIIIPKRRSVGLSPAVAKASAGAVEHMAVAKVTNINSAVEELKQKGLWIMACEADGQPYDEMDYDIPLCIIMGSEENGISKQVIKNSDYVISLPMKGKINSLNVSCAAAAVLYRVVSGRK
ncbi:MAG: 23S rRNA (guanosine(2251)-2'-O)-methyltransferase RlmB [Ruminococcaceae bacterium]|nr:23S rRNA (guanosine(2251)-2'-O)-methyltransferase RlmB [Oscillospiraceae bacterium]